MNLLRHLVTHQAVFTGAAVVIVVFAATAVLGWFTRGQALFAMGLTMANAVVIHQLVWAEASIRVAKAQAVGEALEAQRKLKERI